MKLRSLVFGIARDVLNRIPGCGEYDIRLRYGVCDWLLYVIQPNALVHTLPANPRPKQSIAPVPGLATQQPVEARRVRHKAVRQPTSVEHRNLVISTCEMIRELVHDPESADGPPWVARKNKGNTHG